MLRKCVVVWTINFVLVHTPKKESEHYTVVTGGINKCHFSDRLEYQLPPGVRLDQRSLNTTKLCKLSWVLQSSSLLYHPLIKLLCIAICVITIVLLFIIMLSTLNIPKDNMNNNRRMSISITSNTFHIINQYNIMLTNRFKARGKLLRKRSLWNMVQPKNRNWLGSFPYA